MVPETSATAPVLNVRPSGYTITTPEKGKIRMTKNKPQLVEVVMKVISHKGLEISLGSSFLTSIEII